MSAVYNFSTNPLFKRLFKRNKDAPIFPIPFVKPNYMGPGNSLEYKYLMEKKPINTSDRYSRSHDLSYAYAQNQEDKALQSALIRHADRKMIERLRDHSPVNAGDFIMKRLGMHGIQAKILGENLLQHDVEYGKKDLEDHINIIDSLKRGGIIKRTGFYEVHRNEKIIT